MSTTVSRSVALACVAFFAAVLAGWTTPVSAAEQIVLPYDCSVVGGRVQVRPSGDQAYRIYGSRKQDQYRACSEQSPDRCRTFLVQSFTMACGRERAEWPDVYAAISRVTDGRAFYNNDGRLYYRVGPRETRDSYPFPESTRASGIVEMPEGFAPMAGVDAIFTPLDPRVAELEDGARPDARAYRDLAPPPPAAEKPSFSPAIGAKPAETPKVAETRKPIEAAKPDASNAQVVLEPKPIEPKPLETASTNRTAAEVPVTVSSKTDAPQTNGAPATSTATTSPSTGSPTLPTILNNPAAKEVEAASKTETVVAAAEVEAGGSVSAKPAAPQPEPKVESWTAPEGSSLSLPPLAFAILIAAATLAVLLLILKKQAAAPIAAGPVRVPIEPTLPGFEPKMSPTGTSLTVREMPEPPALSSDNPTSDLPVTRAEALKLLGLNTDASEPLIRKLVEALRQSWHPDLATGDADRAAREERIKAINVAADILLRSKAA